MRTFSQQSKTTSRITPEKSVVRSRNPKVSSILHLQRTIGNKTVLRQLQSKSDRLEAVSNATASHRERSVEMPGEEEQTVNGGTATPSAPATRGCDCVPSSVQITNVRPYRRGSLYGHDFDVEVSLTYFAAASGAGTDAQLFWFERTDRPPAWQGLTPNVWNDMFAMFPTSGTFDGWTRNRTKPCPGTETATIHDPPGASVDLPARTLEFDIYVRGQRISHNARAKQVLEPDGSGGVRTQTFDILPSALGPLAGP